ncbi:MAG TPA: hypothetical protein VN544_03725 [Gaiellaceae bacterium]|jgi:hypothetical protein|nr:hypothetical protein [Gaiellaceae bacterium]
MKRTGFVVLIVVGLATAAATASGHETATPNAARCGGTLWRLKTFSDIGRWRVRLTPEVTTIGDIGKRASPRLVPRVRRTHYQRQAWEVVAQVTQFRLESGGLRLVLYDAGSYLNAVIPLPSCLSAKTRARPQLAAVWKQFVGACAQPTTSWQPLGAIAYVGGIGFWSQKRTVKGAARNGAELHPVTDIRIVAGC